jgi:predicted nucleic acid-binding protein
MSSNRILLDTNILIYLLQGDEELREILEDKIWYISFITEIELLLKPNISDAETKAIKALIQECFVIEMNGVIKEMTISTGQKHKLKPADSIIYASASYLSIPFITADRIFKRLTKDDTQIFLYEV